MKKNKSRQHRAPAKSKKRAKRQQGFRRMEPLETRSMLAGDLLSAVHNDFQPLDVNADGQFNQMDVDTLLSNLRSKKAAQRSLIEGEQTLYLDVDNDGILTNRDLLAAIDALSIEGEAASTDFSVDVDLRIIPDAGATANEGGTTTIGVNEYFTLEIYITDTSSTPSGIDQAYVDVLFDSTLFAMDQPISSAITLGPGFSGPAGGTVPNNVTPYGAFHGNTDASFVEPGVLKYIGGFSAQNPTATRLLASIRLRSIAETDMSGTDFSVLIQDYTLPGNDMNDTVSSFNQENRDGDIDTDENLNATYLNGSGTAEIVRFVGGSVNLVVQAQQENGANFDAYDVNEDFFGDDESSTPPKVTINDVEYYVLDVLANDRDGNGSLVMGDRSRFNIDSVTQPAEGSVIIQENAQSVPEIAALMGVDSHEVLLYQVPDGLGGLAENFQYTMTDSGMTDNAGTTTAGVYVFINEVNQPVELIEDPFEVEVESGIESDVIDIMDNVLPGEDSDTPTFVGFFDINGDVLDASDLQGTFTPVLDDMDQPTGEFTYISNMPGLVESIIYRVDDGSGQITEGTITFTTQFNSLLSGVVFFDVDRDGNVDDNAGTNASPEARIGGVTVQLLDGSTVIETTTTDSQGAYSFSGFDEGTYSVRVIDPRFLIKGYTTTGGFTVTGNTISGITVGNGQAGQYTGLNFGYFGRQAQYIGFGDSIGSNTENSIVLAFSKSGGTTNLEWFAVDMGWDRLVRIRPEYAYLDPATGSAQIAFEVSVDGVEEPQFVVQAFSPSTPGYRIVANTSEGMIIRINGSASQVMTNLAAVDAAFANM